MQKYHGDRHPNLMTIRPTCAKRHGGRPARCQHRRPAITAMSFDRLASSRAWLRRCTRYRVTSSTGPSNSRTKSAMANTPTRTLTTSRLLDAIEASAHAIVGCSRNIIGVTSHPGRLSLAAATMIFDASNEYECGHKFRASESGTVVRASPREMHNASTKKQSITAVFPTTAPTRCFVRPSSPTASWSKLQARGTAWPSTSDPHPTMRATSALCCICPPASGSKPARGTSDATATIDDVLNAEAADGKVGSSFTGRR